MSFGNTLRTALTTGAVALCAFAASHAGAGTIHSEAFKSLALQRSWAYNVYLPTGYAPDTGARYPVLYLLHSNDADRNEWPVKGRLQQTADALIASGEMPPAIIVMPDADTNWHVDLREKAETAFVTEFIPHIEKTYAAMLTREARLLGGVSMGGYGALRFAWRYPENFGAAALISPAIYNPEPPPTSAARRVGVFTTPGSGGAFEPEVWKANNYPALWDGYREKKIPVRLYIVSGDDDEFYVEDEAARLYALLRKNAQPAELRIVNGKHDWRVWAPALPEALKYLFRDVPRQQPHCAQESTVVPYADNPSGKARKKS